MRTLAVNVHATRHMVLDVLTRMILVPCYLDRHVSEDKELQRPLYCVKLHKYSQIRCCYDAMQRFPGRIYGAVLYIGTRRTRARKYPCLVMGSPNSSVSRDIQQR